MRGAVSINLASEPFRRDRPFVVAAIAASAALGGLLLYQLSIGMIERGERVALNEQVEAASVSLNKLRVETASLRNQARRPGYTEAMDYAVFLNGLILRKGISWTRIFADLEQVMPHDVRLISIRPQVNTDNQIQLDMTLGSNLPEPVINMIIRLEGSPKFGDTTVGAVQPPTQSDTLYRYRVTVNYAPQL